MRAAFDALGAWGAAAGMAEVTSNADESHVPEPYCFRAVFISDLHLGTPGCQATALLDFLKHHPSKTLYLVGDIVDGWQLRRRWFWPQAHNDVVQKLLRSARKGCRVVFVPGNHDEFARAFVGHSFGGIEVVEDAVHLTADGRQLWVTHGDYFDGVSSAPSGWHIWGTTCTSSLSSSIGISIRCGRAWACHIGRCLHTSRAKSKRRSTM